MRVALFSAVLEFVATASFIAISTGTGVGLLSNPAVQAVGTAMAFGFTVTGLSFAVANTRAGQMNPILTTALVATKRLTAIQGLLNVGAQFVGAIFGSSIVCALSDCLPKTLLTNTLADGVSVGGAFLGESFGAFVITFVMLETAFSTSAIVQEEGPFAIGFVVFTVHMFLIPFTSCGVNPARALGPAIVSWSWDRHTWLFILAPFTGMSVALAMRSLRNHLERRTAPHTAPAIELP